MPTFATPRPVALHVRFDAGRLAVIASVRDDAVVTVAPTKPGSDADVEHARGTVVELHGTQLRVIAPDVTKRFGRAPSIDVTVELPAGSDASAQVASADVQLTGELGDVTVSTASGDVSVEHSSRCAVTVASGDVVCERTAGDLSVKSASGDVRFDGVGGTASLTSASGDINGTDVAGDLELRTASGDASIGRVGASATVRSASGDLRLGAVRRGTVEADSASGDITIGVVEGSAAWLDLHSLTGDVSSSLDDSGPPDEGVDVVSIHARSLSGDVTIRRATSR